MWRWVCVVLAMAAGPVAAQEIVFESDAIQDCVMEAPNEADCIDAAARHCMEYSQDGETTYVMGACWQASAEWWDAELNAVFQGLRASDRSVDPALADALRDMQRAWIPFRDAACLYEYAHWGGGTGGNPAHAAWYERDDRVAGPAVAADLGGLVLRTKPTVDAVARDGWALPARLNMAEEVCDRWAAATPDAPAILTVALADGAGRHAVRRPTHPPPPDRVAVTTFAALREMADGLARWLAGRGIKLGDRVGIYRSQSPWTAAAHIAVWKLGAISIPLFTLFGPDALSSRLRDSGAVAVICDPDSAREINSLSGDLEALHEVVVPEALTMDPAPWAAAETGPDTPAVLIYTSGTTGPPKGALHGHRVLRGHLPGVELSHDLLPQPGDVLWTAADWAWIGGLFDVLMPGLWHGLPVVAARLPKFSADGAAQVITAAAVRNVFFPPTALRVLRAAGARIGGLRSVASGGEPLGPEMLAWGRDALGVEINEFYGQTECNMTVTSCGARYPARPGWIGRPVPGHTVAVIDADDQGEGDIAVRRGSAAMMLGYWNKPEATARKFRGDWMLTGDRGFADGGYIRFAGRDDDVITSSGYRIGPAEIEDCLQAHPDVAAAGVVGAPDPDRTQIVVAFVVLRGEIEGSDLLRSALQTHVKERLAAHEYPRRLYFVEALPMTVTGKILRRELRRDAGLRRAGETSDGASA